MAKARCYEQRLERLMGLPCTVGIPSGKPKDGYDEGQANQIVAYTEGIRQADIEHWRG